MQRYTIQRALVLQAVQSLKCHATVDEVFLEVSKKHPNISKATVYRNLKELAENGEIQKLDILDNTLRFDHLCYQHSHIRCVKCGKICDIDMPTLDTLEQHIVNTNGFSVNGYDLIFKGICADCQKNSELKLSK